MVLELKTQLVARRTDEYGPKLVKPTDVVAYLGDMKHMAQEALVAVGLNAKNRVIDKYLISIGTVNSAPATGREVFRTAILDAASSIILIHNHVSNDCCPSADDIAVTRRMVQAGEILGISVLDHIIIGGDDHLSLKEAVLVKF